MAEIQKFIFLKKREKTWWKIPIFFLNGSNTFKNHILEMK